MVNEISSILKSIDTFGVENTGLIAVLGFFVATLALAPCLPSIYAFFKKRKDKRNSNPVLSDPNLGNGHLARYSTRSVELLGRDPELKKLQSFIKSEERFLWMQIAGVAGQGKSRLGYELVIWARDEGWNAGFIENYNLDDFSIKWHDWIPEKPYLLVFDYVIGRESYIKTVIQNLAAKSKSLSKTVRVLLLERQRWDQGGIEPSRQSNDSALAIKSEFRAEWFLKIADRSDGNDENILSVCFEDGVVELKELEEKNLVSIVRQMGNLVDKKIFFSDNEIVRWLRHIDAAGRPLYAYFLGQALVEGINPDSPTSSGNTWGRDDLLDAALTRDQSSRWSKLLNDSQVDFGDGSSAERIAVIATIAGGIDFSNSDQRLIVGKFEKSVRRQATILVNGKLGDSSSNRLSIIPPLQPDLLGEWFVLRAFQEGLPKEETLELSWKLSPSKASAFLSRISQDFLDFPETADLLNFTPSGNSSKKAFQAMASEVSVNLYRARCSFPQAIIKSLFDAAESGDLRAINNVGFFLCAGIGIEQNFEKALSLYHIGASKGDGRSMANIGLCFKNGTGVNKNFESALYWYHQGAEAGSGWAMSSLGTCYKEGLGVAKNFDLALHWIRKGAEAGDGQAMCNLGVCYHEGSGVDRNAEMAMDWYSKGAAVGDSQAMACLGASYEQGLGIDVDIEKALFWHRRGADFGNPWAMSNLGSCYKRGVGVKKDLAKAAIWFRSGAVAGSSKAMVSLGRCYQYGEGVEKNFEEAVYWYRKGTDVGDGLAMSNLGFCYRKGLGVEKNVVIGFGWYCQGVLAGDESAKKNFYNALRSDWKAVNGPWSEFKRQAV